MGQRRSPFLLHCSASDLLMGRLIMVSELGMSTCELVEKLQVISAHVGLSDDDLIDVLDAGVSVTLLLNYLEAAISNRLD